ncbi:MAG: hypothetical protein KC933_16615 [Myxococcales bacterium]|nr:hypothetical protein [Myxococcales bacterium]MCB9646624.1 hypothetical protein [Deltaproteobacteria bacterium]
MSASKAAAPAQKSRWRLALIWVGLIAFFGVIQSLTDRMAGNDTYYHIKYAWLIWHEGAIWDFPWLQGTFFKEMWVDKEFLYHVLLIPFTLPGDMYYGAKTAAAFYGGTAIFLTHLVIRRMDAPGSRWQRYSWFFALLLVATSKTMLYRLSTTRVPAASAAAMMIAILVMQQRKWRWLFVVGFFYAWMYHVSVVLVPLALFFALGSRLDDGKWDLRPVLAAAGGVLTGFVINPYFPDSVPVLFKHVIQVGLGSTGLPKGNEWGAYDSWYLLETTGTAWIAVLVGVVAVGGRRATMTGRTLFLLLANALMMVAFFKARRFVEYWPLFAVLFFASALNDLIRDETSWWHSGLAALKARRLNKAVVPVLALALAITAGANAWMASQEAAGNADPKRLAGVTRWLEENTPEGATVYNAQWDIFPELIFYNHHNHWTLGLDPNFTYFLEPRLYYLSDSLGRGEVPEPGRYVAEGFGAYFAMALKGSGFDTTARRPKSGLTVVYEDQYAVAYAVKPDNTTRTIEAEFSPHTDDFGGGKGTCQYLPKGQRDMGFPSAKAVLQCMVEGSDTLSVTYTLDVPEDSRWSMQARFLQNRHPVQAEVLVDGTKAGDTVNLEGDRVMLSRVEKFGDLSLTAGKHEITVRFLVPNPGYPVSVGLDYLRFLRVP